MPNNYDKDIQNMSRYERREREAIEKDQVIHCDLAPYQPGHPHYESLMDQIHENQRHQWPSSLVFNV